MNDKVSFGANIHTMLKSSFFLSGGAMGEFAKETIKDVINQLNLYDLWKSIQTVRSQDDTKKNEVLEASLPERYQKMIDKMLPEIEKEVSWNFITQMSDIIQEPIIRNRMREMIRRRGKCGS